MKDTLETNLPEETGGLEETKKPVETPDFDANEVVEADNSAVEPTAIAIGKMTKEDIINKLTELAEAPADSSRGEVASLKQAYYKLRHNEVEELRRQFLANGGEEKDFAVPADEAEYKIKDLISIYKEKKAVLSAEEERVKAANYALKLQLIEQLKELCESQDDFNKLYNTFKDIQHRWKEVKAVPQEHVNSLWNSYQMYTEQFYDIIKINNQFRDYDFKKNLELKTALCEAVEKLNDEPDAISAFHQLQKLHQQWREIGPVAKELRENLWARFKAASTIINKRHQEHFEKLKAKEQENLIAKTAICEEIEGMDLSVLKSFKDWENTNKLVLGLQEKWKSIGYAPKKYNVKIFERFRAACDNYFKKKNEYFKSLKANLEKNLEAKIALCEKAEALKDSTDWKSTTEKMIALQKEWKKIGPTTRKQTDSTWKRFIAACDYFFEQKNKNTSSQKSIERSNLEAKKKLIAKVNELDESLSHDEAIALLKQYNAEWNEIGFVPFKEKDKVYQEFHEALDKQFDRLKVDMNDRKMQSFRNNISELSSGEKGKGRLFSERDRLMRAYDRMKSELQTYENNMGFLSVSSKGGSGLLKEMERKMEKLKEDMELTIKKIETIDENLD